MTDAEIFSQEKQDRFLILLGTCITEWAWIEEEVFKICHAVLGTSLDRTSTVFYRTPTLEGSLALADDLLKIIFPKPETGKHPPEAFERWVNLLNEIRKEMPIRNHLAHSPIGAALFGTLDDETEEVKEVKEIRMLSYLHDQKMVLPKFAKTKALQQEDLEEHLKNVQLLHMRLRTFRIDDLPSYIDAQ